MCLERNRFCNDIGRNEYLVKMSSVILVHRSLHFSQYVFVVVTMGDKERILSPLQMHFMSHHNFANLREICNITTLAS